MQTRLARALTRGWTAFAHVSGATAIAILIGWVVVEAFSRDGPVIETLGPPKDVTGRVLPSGVLSFVVEFERHAPCPGTVIETFSNVEDKAYIIVTRRPTLSVQPKRYPPTRVNVQLPASVGQGHWKYEQSVQSTCPTYTRTDFFTAFEFEVVAP
jgi:hypothetical protein